MWTVCNKRGIIKYNIKKGVIMRDGYYGIVVCPHCNGVLRVEDIAVDEITAICKLCGKAFDEEDVK